MFKRKNIILSFLLIILTVSVSSGCYTACSSEPAGISQNKRLKDKNEIQIHKHLTPPIQTVKSPLLDKNTYKIADIAEKAVKSVVNIYSTKIIRIDKRQFSPFLNDPFFNRFFGHRFNIPDKQRQKSLGSGVIVSDKGLILTNNHVVEHADKIKVKTADGRTFEAKLIGADPKSDLALIQLKGKIENLVPLKMGDSDKIRLGEIVLAIGSPFGLGSTVTMGIISAKGRANLGIVDYEDFIQTDAAINPGNSGGALVNMKGEVIGINTAILSKTGGSQGVGFAIPSNMAKHVMNSLLKYGKVVRGWLGILIQPVEPEIAKMLGLRESSGVLIGDVVKEGPADKAGLKRGDVIIELDGEKITSTSQLRNNIALDGSGKIVKLKIVRDGKILNLEVKLGELPGKGERFAFRGKEHKIKMYGMEVEKLNSKTRAYYKIPDSFSGLMITSVKPGSKAAFAGLKAGDLILEVNRKPVKTKKDFTELMKKSGHKLLLVYRKGHTMFVILKD